MMQRYKTKTRDTHKLVWVCIYTAAAIVLVLDIFFWRTV